MAALTLENLISKPQLHLRDLQEELPVPLQLIVSTLQGSSVLAAYCSYSPLHCTILMGGLGSYRSVIKQYLRCFTD